MCVANYTVQQKQQVLVSIWAWTKSFVLSEMKEKERKEKKMRRQETAWTMVAFTVRLKSVLCNRTRKPKKRRKKRKRCKEIAQKWKLCVCSHSVSLCMCDLKAEPKFCPLSLSLSLSLLVGNHLSLSTLFSQPADVIDLQVTQKQRQQRQQTNKQHKQR